MEERDLSMLSLRELIQMLDAILLPLQNNGDGGVKKEKESEAQVEQNKVVDLGKANEEEMPIEAKETSEILLDNSDYERVEKNERQPNEEEIEGDKEVEAEKQLKLQPFSVEKKLEEVVGHNKREKMKDEAFSIGKVEPSVFVDVQYTNVSARESNMEMKRGEHLPEKKKPETLEALLAIKIASSSPKFEVQHIYVAGTEATMKMRPTYDTEKAGVKCWRYDKRKKWEKAKTSDGKEEKRDWVLNQVKHIKWGWGRSLKFIKKKKEKEEQGFRVNVAQHSKTGPKSFLAQSYQRVRHVDEGSKRVVSAITTSESSTKTKKHRDTSSSSSAAFASDNLKKIHATALETKTISKIAVLSYSFNDDTTKSNEFKVALLNGWVLDSKVSARVGSPFISFGSHGEILWITTTLEEVHWRGIRAMRWVPSSSFYAVLCHLGKFSWLLTVEAMRRQERTDASLLLVASSKPATKDSKNECRKVDGVKSALKEAIPAVNGSSVYQKIFKGDGIWNCAAVGRDEGEKVYFESRICHLSSPKKQNGGPDAEAIIEITTQHFIVATDILYVILNEEESLLGVTTARWELEVHANAKDFKKSTITDLHRTSNGHMESLLDFTLNGALTATILYGGRNGMNTHTQPLLSILK